MNNVPVAPRSVQDDQIVVPAYPFQIARPQSGGDHSNMGSCVVPPRQVLPYVLPVSPPESWSTPTIKQP
jgi:hypothetical protein